MFSKSVISVLSVLMIVVSLGCSGQNFIPVRPGNGEFAGTTLGMRTVAGVELFAPTDKKAWLEYCIPQVTYTWKVFKNTSWDVPCVTEREIQSVANHSTSTGAIAGALGPVLQAGAIVGGAALIANGIKHSGSTNNTNVSGGNSNATGGAATATSKNTNLNVNQNSQHQSIQGNSQSGHDRDSHREHGRE